MNGILALDGYFGFRGVFCIRWVWGAYEYFGIRSYNESLANNAHQSHDINWNEAGTMLFALRARYTHPSQKVSMFLSQLRKDVYPVSLATSPVSIGSRSRR
jgi:hypothetical protein